MTPKSIQHLLHEGPLTAAEKVAVAGEADEGGRQTDSLRSELAALGAADAALPGPDLADAVMRRLGQRHEPGLLARLGAALAPLVRRRFSPITLVPAGAVGAVLGFFLVSSLTGSSGADARAIPTVIESDIFPEIFEIAAPGAAAVSLSGDFNDWSADSIPLADDDRDGVWSVTLQLRPGRYTYSYIVDGHRTVPMTAAVLVGDGGSANVMLRHE